jgi:hypothetical protein
MKIPRVVSTFTALAALTVVFGAVFVGCGKGGSSGMNSGGGGAPAVAPRDVAISCGGGAGEATLTTVSPVMATATLTGNQQVPAVCTGAVGTGTVTVDTATGAISGSITLNSIANVTAAHIHDAAAGANGGIIIALMQSMSNSAEWDVPVGSKLTSTQITDFNNGALYFNAHTSVNPDGEVRGQIGRSVFTGAMTSAQERLSDTSATASTATGTGKVVLDPSSNVVTASFHVTGLSSASTVAHIHTGAVGAAPGPVTFSMSETPMGSGTFTVTTTPLTPQQLSDLRAGNMYFNVHTMNNPNGEIRGQIGRVVRIAKPFSGANQVPAVTSSGSGSGFAVLDVATRTFIGSMTINNIQPTLAHIHAGAAGAAGGIIVNFTVTASGSSSPSSAAIVPPDGNSNSTPVQQFLDDGTYMNVHTTAHMDGEIRGQLDIP